MTARDKAWQVAFMVALGLGGIAMNAITDAITGSPPHMDPWKGKLFLGLIGGVIGLLGNIANTLGLAAKVPGAGVVLLACGWLLGTPATARAEAPPPLSFDRVALGVSAQGVLYDDGTSTTGFLPQAWGSYSVTSQASLAASVERDFAHDWTFYHAGARVALTPPTSLVQLGAGVDAVWYDGRAVADSSSWSASIRAAWVVARSSSGRDLAYLIGSAEYDVDNALKTYRVGLRIPLVGGK